MHRIAVPCAVVAIMLAFVAGCNKQEKQSALKKGTEMPMMGKKSAVDTSDIFKEFYSEDTAGQGKAKKISKNTSAKGQTFSPSSAASQASGEFAENGRYVVQVACVPTKAFAEKMAASLKEKNFPAYTAAVQNPTPKLSGTYYRVRIGAFKGLSAAKAFGENSLVPAGYQYWVDKKSNDNVGMEGYGLGGGVSTSNATNSYPSSSPASSSWSSIPTSSETSAPAAPSAPETQAASAPPSSPAAAEPAKASPAPAATAPSSSPGPASATPAKEPAKIAPPPADKSSKGSGEWATDTSSSSGGW